MAPLLLILGVIFGIQVFKYYSTKPRRRRAKTEVPLLSPAAKCPKCHSYDITPGQWIIAVSNQKIDYCTCNQCGHRGESFLFKSKTV